MIGAAAAARCFTSNRAKFMNSVTDFEMPAEGWWYIRPSHSPHEPTLELLMLTKGRNTSTRTDEEHKETAPELSWASDSGNKYEEAGGKVERASPCREHKNENTYNMCGD